MRILDIILTEAREAPLYHFTSEGGFFKILSTDTLVAGGAKMRGGGIDPQGRIYFTRDYGRQFLPANILSGSWGFRVNQDLLRQRFGRKLVAGGQGKHSPWTEKKRQAWLADPKNAAEIERVKSGTAGYRSRTDGADTQDIVKGTIGQSQRWESEEHLNVGSVPNFHEYITGIVYAGGKSADPHRLVGLSNKTINFRARNPRQAEALDDLCGLLMTHFRGEAGFKQRDALIAYMDKFNIPFVFQQQDFDAKAVKQRMIDIWRERKAERARRSQEVQKTFTVFKNVQGGGVVVGAPDFWTATDRALQDHPHSFPDGIFGAQEINGPRQWFAVPKTEVGTMPPRQSTPPVEQPA